MEADGPVQPSRPAPWSIPVAMRRPVLVPALAELGPDQRGDFELHHLGRDSLDRCADHVSVLIQEHLLDDLL